MTDRDLIEVLIVVNFNDAYHMLRLALFTENFGITPFYGPASYYYLRLGIGLGNVLENIPN